MNRKRRSKICCLSGILLLILLLAGVQRVSAMTTGQNFIRTRRRMAEEAAGKKSSFLPTATQGNTRLIFLMDSKETIRMGITYRSV